MSGFKGNVEATVDLKPKRSQIFVLSCSVLCGLSICGGFVLQLKGIPGWWAPYAIALLCLIFAFASFWLSHKNIDMHGAAPTQLNFGPDGFTLTTDSRNANKEGPFGNLGSLFKLVEHLRPVPIPKGLVDDHGKVIEGSEAAAKALADTANEDARRRVDEVISAVSSAPQSATEKAGLSPLIDSEDLENSDSPSLEHVDVPDEVLRVANEGDAADSGVSGDGKSP